MSNSEVEGLLKRLTIKDLRVQCRQRKLMPAGSKDELADRLKEHMHSTQDFAMRNDDGSIMADDKASQLFGVSIQPSNASPGNNYSRPDGQNVGNFLGERPSSRVLAAPGGNSNFAFSSAEPGNTHSPPPQAPQPRMQTTPSAGQSPQKPPLQVATKASFLDSMTAKIAGKSGVTYSPAKSKANAGSPEAPPSVPESAEENVPLANEAPGSAPSPTPIGVNNNNYSRPAGQNVGNFLTDKPSSRVLAPPGGASSFRLG